MKNIQFTFLEATCNGVPTTGPLMNMIVLNWDLPLFRERLEREMCTPINSPICILVEALVIRLNMGA